MKPGPRGVSASNRSKEPVDWRQEVLEVHGRRDDRARFSWKPNGSALDAPTEPV